MRKQLAAIAAVALACAGCATPDPPLPPDIAEVVAAQNHVVAALPLAKHCWVRDTRWGGYNTEIEIPVEVSNEGGRCSMGMAWFETADTSAAIRSLPKHGMVGLFRSAEKRRLFVRYAPQPGYVGPDVFTVRLEPSHTLLTERVTVLPAK